MPKKPINHCVLVLRATRKKAIAMLQERGAPIRTNADNTEIARMLCTLKSRPMPELPEGIGHMVNAFVNGTLDAAPTGLPSLVPLKRRPLHPFVQQRMDEFRAIPSLVL